MTKREGLVHIYTGEGKGKTTAALGLAVRMLGYGKRVLLLRFVKGGYSGELATIAKLGESFRYEQINPFSKKIFALTSEENQQLVESTYSMMEKVAISVEKGEYDLYIFDEVMGALRRNLLTCQMVQDLIKKKAGHVEIVLTGRDAPEELRALADYITVMQKEAHPFDRKIAAREGVEY